ncbi:MAG: hypothetical protein EOP83_20000 [Verrucomicrobiaceae bacterium]|nr:MAG: hypothetical protein EOP83_20000 [Verrucomicrobiaceae bacterium]
MSGKHSSMELDADEVRQACYYTQEHINGLRKAAVDRIIEEEMQEKRFFFGGFVRKARTRAEAAEVVEEEQSFRYVCAMGYDGKRMETVQNIGLMIDDNPTRKTIRISAHDYDCFREFWMFEQREAQQKRIRTKALMRRIGAGHVPPTE